MDDQNSATINRVLEQWAGEPVLMDVGASGEAPAMWALLAPRSYYIAFDPDQREMAHATGEGPFKRKTVVNEAITADAGSSEVKFFLTRSPFCSSTLHPDHALVANFFGAERFDVVSETTARAATLNDVLGRLNVERLDWLKVDTQGTDRRIWDSLSDALRSKVLAVDLEPGLRGAYQGEDLFGDVHNSMRRDGFWLSHMQTKGFVRMRQGTLDELTKREPKMDRAFIERAVRRTPGWTELRYLRSIESLQASGGTQRDFALLWVIATIDNQHGFALDIAAHWEKQFGADATSNLMRDHSTGRIRAAYEKAQQSAQRGLRKRLRSVVRRLIPQAIVPSHAPKPVGTGSGGGNV
jgi:FkbM family methyltransferase